MAGGDHVEHLEPHRESSSAEGMWSSPAGSAWAPPSPPSPPPARTERFLGRRVAAGFIDLVPLVLIAFGLAERVDNDSGTFFTIAGVHLLVLVAIVFVYYFGTEMLTGTTPGKRVMGLVVIGEDGHRARGRAIALRTLLRGVDGLPALYLVGFIVALATPDGRRVGDLVGHTTVVRSARSTASASTRAKTVVLAAIGAIALAGGVVGTVARATETPPSERLAGFEVDRDMVPLVRRVMSVLEQPTAERLGALFPPGAVTTADMNTLISGIEAHLGQFLGDYTIDDHRKLRDVDVTAIGRVDIMQFNVTARFARATQTVIVSLAVIDRDLTLIRVDFVA